MAVSAPPDWRQHGDYAWLAEASRSTFAWEWLRRSPAYRRRWREAGAALMFGLVRAEPPDRDAREAVPLWSHVCDPSVLMATAIAPDRWAGWRGKTGATGERAGGTGAFVRGPAIDFTDAPVALHCIHIGGVRHLLVGEALRSLRIDVLGDAPLDRSVIMHWHLIGVDGIAPRLSALRRLAGLLAGDVPSRLCPPSPAAGRWILALRCADALDSGASQQQIARALFGPLVPASRWRIEAPSIRLRAQRLVAFTRARLAAHPCEWFS